MGEIVPAALILTRSDGAGRTRSSSARLSPPSSRARRRRRRAGHRGRGDVGGGRDADRQARVRRGRADAREAAGDPAAATSSLLPSRSLPRSFGDPLPPARQCTAALAAGEEAPKLVPAQRPSPSYASHDLRWRVAGVEALALAGLGRKPEPVTLPLQLLDEIEQLPFPGRGGFPSRGWPAQRCFLGTLSVLPVCSGRRAC